MTRFASYAVCVLFSRRLSPLKKSSYDWNARGDPFVFRYFYVFFGKNCFVEASSKNRTLRRPGICGIPLEVSSQISGLRIEWPIVTITGYWVQWVQFSGDWNSLAGMKMVSLVELKWQCIKHCLKKVVPTKAGLIAAPLVLIFVSWPSNWFDSDFSPSKAWTKTQKRLSHAVSAAMGGPQLS